MVKKLFISVLLFLVSAPALARVDTAWVRRYNGPDNGYDTGNAIAVDNSGNVYVTGYRTGFATLSDYTTIKYTSRGDTAWVSRYDGPEHGWDGANAIAVDRFGNVYVTGYSFGVGTGADYATVKYDSLGNELWVRRYNGSGDGDDAARGIAVDDSGNACVTGYSYSSETDYDYVTIKYYSNGNTAWVRVFDGSGSGWDWAWAIAVDHSGAVCVTGESYAAESDRNYTTIKYSPHGDTAWIRRYNGPGNGEDGATALAVDASGNFYVTGHSYHTLQDMDYATIKYYSNGGTAWVERYNGPASGPDESRAVAVDAHGHVYVTGSVHITGG